MEERSVENSICVPFPGTLMLIGGGLPSDGSTGTAIFEAMKRASRKARPRVALFSSSRKTCQEACRNFFDPDPVYGSLKDNFEKLGMDPVFIPLAVDSAEAVRNDHVWLAVLESCDIAYLQGGDQFLHIRSFLEDDESPSLMLKGLEAVLQRGGVVAGTSAGMAAMSELSFGLGTSKKTAENYKVEEISVRDIPVDRLLLPKVPDTNVVTAGLGLLKGSVLLDTHFCERERQGRLLAVMCGTGVRFGIGADEGTCISISGHIGEVVGDGCVTVYHAGEGGFRQMENGSFSAMGVEVICLKKGDVLDFSEI